MLELELSHILEHRFISFGYEMHFDSDIIRSKPREAIIDGLQKLCHAGIITESEFSAHISNFNWGNKSLQEVLEIPGAQQNIEALIRNLDYWGERDLQAHSSSSGLTKEG